jgi:hypothetical protein
LYNDFITIKIQKLFFYYKKYAFGEITSTGF